MSAAPLALRVEGLEKSFGGVRALQGLNLEVRAGEVHALLGQNGCGKSTLVKVLTGVHDADAGSVTLFGEQLALPVTDSRALGVAVVHQDIGLVDGMTVLENLGVATRYGTRLLAAVSLRRERERFYALMTSLGIDLPLDARVADLSPAERALLGIVRAVSLVTGERQDRLVILDEPTAALGRQESERLLQLMRGLAAAGAAVVFISHRLNEVSAVSDRVTVVRDGRAVLTAPAGQLDRRTIVAAVLGRNLEDFVAAPPVGSGGAEILDVRGLRAGVLEDLDLAVRAGEIVGVTGLAGMGQDDLAAVLAGADTPTAGSVSVDGERLAMGSSRKTVGAGLAVVPGNRLRDGCWADASARENVTLPVLRRFSGRWSVRGRSERSGALRALTEVGLRPLAPERPVATFSGGNQQKVVFAKWLQTDPRVLVLDEPTQGVDAGAAQELLNQVVRTAEGGAAVLVLSGDHEQLVKICHRVVVLHSGRVVAEVPRERLSESVLLAASSGAN